MGDQNIGKYMFGNFGIPWWENFWEGEPVLAAKIGQGDQFFLPKSVRGDQFLGGPILV